MKQVLQNRKTGRPFVGEVPVPVRYMPEASSINFRRSVRYGFGTLGATAQLVAKRLGFPASSIFVSSR